MRDIVNLRKKKFRDLNKWELVAAHIKLDISGKRYFDQPRFKRTGIREKITRTGILEGKIQLKCL